MPKLEIVWKLDMERLSKNNSREVLKQYLGEELTKWEMTKKSYARKENQYA